MLNCDNLYNCTTNPKINEISLDLLRLYYEQYLMPFTYKYNVIDEDENSFDIELRFDKENFCHLLGIETIVKRNVNSKMLWNYKGVKGWNKIRTGKLSFTELKEINKSLFKSAKSKFVFFYLIPKIIESPKAIKYDKSKVKGGTSIEGKIIFYDKQQNSYVHIFLEYDEEKKYHIARSFCIEKITDHNTGTKFIDGQTKITVTKIENNK